MSTLVVHAAGVKHKSLQVEVKVFILNDVDYLHSSGTVKES
jgi:hypothetical protein